MSGIKAATGVGAHPAAFEGELELSVNGLPADGAGHRGRRRHLRQDSLLLPDWTSIDPGDYGAPDPAQLMEPDGGFSGLIAAIDGVEQGECVRGGDDNKEFLTEFTGTIPAESVEALIPTASGDFDAVLTISDNGELRRAELTGVFYDDADSLTYTLTLDDYGTEADITAP